MLIVTPGLPTNIVQVETSSLPASSDLIKCASIALVTSNDIVTVGKISAEDLVYGEDRR